MSGEETTFWVGFWQGMFWGGVVGLPVFGLAAAMRFFG